MQIFQNWLRFVSTAISIISFPKPPGPWTFPLVGIAVARSSSATTTFTATVAAAYFLYTLATTLLVRIVDTAQKYIIFIHNDIIEPLPLPAPERFNWRRFIIICMCTLNLIKLYCKSAVTAMLQKVRSRARTRDTSRRRRRRRREDGMMASGDGVKLWYMVRRRKSLRRPTFPMRRPGHLPHHPTPCFTLAILYLQIMGD